MLQAKMPTVIKRYHSRHCHRRRRRDTSCSCYTAVCAADARIHGSRLVCLVLHVLLPFCVCVCVCFFSRLVASWSPWRHVSGSSSSGSATDRLVDDYHGREHHHDQLAVSISLTTTLPATGKYFSEDLERLELYTCQKSDLLFAVNVGQVWQQFCAHIVR